MSDEEKNPDDTRLTVSDYFVADFLCRTYKELERLRLLHVPLVKLHVDPVELYLDSTEE